ncbi:bifunctional aspartate kinase/homoserine dehydrogenase I [Marinicella rhabdoformis]|uniref:bifunctional aspartate kinase/homoserine dehydrogenase I n=1 Tax=Marinicella rhabdoformis TaxID=2580566 RepID=UPI0012AED1FA|nr:bifunctional aspartate kinase/homoserine dehydrogenase I [Marinicella rhabdoformis]
MKVMKFGGSSLASAERFASVAHLIVAERDRLQGPPYVVLSAPAGVTNELCQMVTALNEGAVDGTDSATNTNAGINTLHSFQQRTSQLLNDSKPLLSDAVWMVAENQLKSLLNDLSDKVKGCQLLGSCPAPVATALSVAGEQFSVLLMQAHLSQLGCESAKLNPADFILVGDQDLVDVSESSVRFDALSLAPMVHLMPGFYGEDQQGQLHTLGRNGSDYSAAVLAVCTHAESCEIWTDVNGIYHADPRIVEGAQLIEHLSFREAIDLSYFGAKVLHPNTVLPLAQQNICCVIKNSQNPEAKGSMISNNRTSKKTVKAISNLSDVSMINVSGAGMKGMVGMAARVFDVISQAQISVVLISQTSSEYGISLCVSGAQAEQAVDVLNRCFELEIGLQLIKPIQCQNHLSVISVVGDSMYQHKGTASRFFAALAHAGVNVIAIAQDASEHSISAVVRSERIEDAVIVCDHYLFSKQARVDAFLIGCGTVGQALIGQIKKQQAWLKKKQIDLRVVGIANSKKQLLSEQGLDLSQWQQQLDSAPASLNAQALADWAQDQHLINPVVIDCTSSESVSQDYETYLAGGLHVVTANKKANTDSMSRYVALHQLAAEKQKQFLYETNVGAGLPVINNLQNLRRAGDELLQFEGILSGALSYIFGAIHQGMSLSEATAKAKSLGYTEPNPAEDLSGLDVARKVLLMAREAGLSLELSDVVLDAVVPDDLAQISEADAFMQALPSYDDAFSEKVKQAEANNQVLRYVASITDGQCRVAIQAVDSDHPLYDIQAGENALAMLTEYYQPKPFVIRGYGAGAEVTAAGLFGDLMRIDTLSREY